MRIDAMLATRVTVMIEIENLCERVGANLASALGGELEGARIAVWGLALKPQTDDLRESPALALIDALVDATDWNEYRHPDSGRIRAAPARPVAVDGRNLYDPANMSALGCTYLSIGRPAA